MKKKILMLMAAILVFGGSAGAAYANQDVTAPETTIVVSDNAAVQDDEAGTEAEVKIEAESDDNAAEVELDDDAAEVESDDDAAEVESDDDAAEVESDDDAAEVESDDDAEAKEDAKEKKQGEAKGSKGYKGLLKAIENVKDKPAGAVIANLLLTKYQAQLTPEQKAELEGIVEADQALTAAADILAEQGSITEAVQAQKEAIKANKKKLQYYKKLGKLYEKIGKIGVKLYVNGEEPSFETAPFIRDGSTLVPFRAIAEALKAEVSWNPEERSVTVTREGISVKLFIGSTTAYVNGQEATLEVPGEIVNGSTVVPVRFISEALKADVQWEGETQSVVINEK